MDLAQFKNDVRAMAASHRADDIWPILDALIDKTVDVLEAEVVPKRATYMSKAWGQGFNACRDRVLDRFAKFRNI